VSKPEDGQEKKPCSAAWSRWSVQGGAYEATDVSLRGRQGEKVDKVVRNAEQ
jgi:hypothetical protein